MRHLTAFLLLCVACEPEGYSDVVYLHYLPALPHHDPETIEGAEEYLGMQILIADDTQLSKAVIMTKMNHPYDGYGGATEFIHPPCSPNVWAIESEFIIAHEIGHALGLQHVDDDDNLMSPDHKGAALLTDEQVDEMQRFAWRQQHDCD